MPAVPIAALEQLADADAFLGLGLTRRQALWAIRGLDDTELPLMIAAGPPAAPAQSREPKVTLRRMPAGGEVVADYRSVGLTLREHPVSFIRDEIERLGAVPCAALPESDDRASASPSPASCWCGSGRAARKA